MAAYFLASLYGFLGVLIELVLARALDFSLNSFVAWMCISLAMFGIGLGGLLLDWRPMMPAPRVLTLLGLVLLALPVVYNRFSFAGAGAAIVFNYGGLILLLSAPFALIGWGLMQIFALPNVRTRYLYLFDLAGSGAGAAAAFFLLGPLSPAQILVVAGLVCMVFSQLGRRRAVAAVSALMCSAVLLKLDPAWLEFQAKDVKRLHRLLAAGKHESTLWTPVAKVDVVNAIKGTKVLVYDGGEMLSIIYPFDGDYAKLRREFRDRLFTDFWNPGVVVSHFLRAERGSRVLAVGAAGGQEVKAALVFGAASVEVAEIMGELLELGKQRYSHYNGGIFLRPEVNAFARDGRVHIRSGGKTYDIIQLNSVHGSSSRGSSMGALQVSPLVTVEAFAEYFSHLAPEGILHLNYPYYPRLITTMAEAWQRMGRSEFRRHVMVVESGHQRDLLTTVLVKMSPWTEPEVQQVEELFQMSDSSNYRMAENPLRGGRLLDEFFNGQWQKVADNVPYRIFPATDDQPYFKFLRKGPRLNERIPHPAIPADVDNYLFNWRTAGLPGDVFPLLALGAGCFAIFLAAMLLAWRRFKGGVRSWSAASYFFLTGFAFIALETFFVYRAGLWLGAPHLALAVGLGIILIAAGLGGSWARWSPAQACILTAVAAGCASWIPTGNAVVLSLVGCGLVMGMPFVAAIEAMRLQGRARSGAFLISGLGAGFGGYAAVVTSLAWGFSAVLVVACGAYLAAAIVSKRGALRPVSEA